MENKILVKKPQYGYYVGHSLDFELRRKASSGGIGTELMKYLLDKESYDCALTFFFEKKLCKYVPSIVTDSKSLNNCGSIYQDINIPKFLSENINNLGDKVVISCLPCQVDACRSILKKAGKESFIISFSCSGQTTIEGTWKYYELLGIDRKDVDTIQYRGNGWPSGIQIKLNDGSLLFRGNWTKPWTTMNSSLLYKPNRCLFCKLDTSYSSDISLADPWLDYYKKNDNIGNTMFLVNTCLGKGIIDNMQQAKVITFQESSVENYCTAQKPNVEKHVRVERFIKYYNMVIKLKKSKLYTCIMSRNSFTLKTHILILQIIKKLS